MANSKGSKGSKTQTSSKAQPKAKADSSEDKKKNEGLKTAGRFLAVTMGAVAGYFLYPLYGVYCAVGCVLAGFGLAASPEIKEKVSGYIAERKAKNEEKKKTEKKTTKQVAGPSRAAA